MKISEGTKVSELIRFNPESIDVIASINHHFEKLRNPLLRKILASRVTIKDAARIGGCSVETFFSRLAEIGFEVEQNSNVTLVDNVPSDFSLPSGAKVSLLDVRSDIAAGKDPFLKIIEAIDNLPAGEYLKLINTFEPAPLITILKEKKYLCSVVPEADLISTYIFKSENSQPFQLKKSGNDSGFEAKLNAFKNKIKCLDVRSMEMPGPMVTILSELETLPVEQALHVQHRRVPHLLIPELKQRGIHILIKEVKEGSVELLIYR